MKKHAAIVILVALGLGFSVGSAACDDPARKPPTFTPTSGTGVLATSGGGGMGGGMATGSTGTGTGTTSSTSNSTSGTSGSTSTGNMSSTGALCMMNTCEPPCGPADTCIEVTPCNFQCTQGAIGDPCATTADCVALLVCNNQHVCE